LSHDGNRNCSFSAITGNSQPVSKCKPNGSAKRIIDWAEKSNLDSNQQRAFEVITGSFVLSYYDTATESKESRAPYQAQKKKLQILVHNDTREDNRLICFHHGPGGSGKSAVIDLVVLYANSFCKLCWDDFCSSDCVMVDAALTGVAAALLQGETTHSALYLNHRTLGPSNDGYN
jgi:hypothetical protein